MQPDYVRDNDVERQRLRALAQAATDEDLGRRLPSGITIAQVFSHMAFWDDYSLALLQQWAETGFDTQRTNFEAVNAALLDVTARLPVRSAVELALEAAERVDDYVVAVPAELVARLETEGYQRTVRRAIHRRQHLGQIEKAIQDSRDVG